MRRKYLCDTGILNAKSISKNSRLGLYKWPFTLFGTKLRWVLLSGTCGNLRRRDFAAAAAFFDGRWIAGEQ